MKVLQGEELGDFAAAMESLRNLVAMTPTDDDAQRQLARLIEEHSTADDLVGALLAKYGYEVRVYGSTRECLDDLAASPTPADILLTDRVAEHEQLFLDPLLQRAEVVERRLVRYRTVGDMSCTGAVESNATTVAAIIARKLIWIITRTHAIAPIARRGEPWRSSSPSCHQRCRS